MADFVPEDRLVDGPSVEGLIILNYGDPAYSSRRQASSGLRRSEEIFLRLIAYLAFADAAAIPARHILEGDAMAEAIVWATPLLEEGILLPERRFDANSHDELADARSLPEIGRRRAEFLDRHATRVRSFKYLELSKTYKTILDSDLALTGAFRRTVEGGRRGRLSAALDRAYEHHVQSGDGTPEKFVASVEQFAPSLSGRARRWAMARYYSTPLLYDSANTREVPRSATDLLIRGGVLDDAILPFDGAAPAEEAFSKLRTSVPADSIAHNHRQYCEALLEVRQALPEARRLFSQISEAAHLKDAGETLSAELRSELARQMKVREAKGRVFTLVSSLVGSAAGLAVGLSLPADILEQVVGSVASGVIPGVAANELQHKASHRRDRKKRPWVLAADRLEKELRGDD